MNKQSRKLAKSRFAPPYLRKLIKEHRHLNRLIDTSKGYANRPHVQALKRMRLRLKDKISAAGAAVKARQS